MTPHPEAAETCKIQGNQQKAAGNFAAAVEHYRRALEFAPGYLAARYNLGLVLHQMQRLDEAEAEFRLVVAADPRDAEALCHLGSLLSARGEHAEAVRRFDQALQLAPADPVLWMALGQAHASAGALEQTLRCFATALRLKPDDPSIRGALLYEMQRACDWSRFDEFAGRQRRSVREGADAQIAPFPFLSIPSTAAEQLLCARKFARDQLRDVARDRAFRMQPQAGSRLRVGYLSADFGEHPVGYLIAELFEMHDRDRFEILGYSLGKDDGGPTRARIVRAFDRFIDVSRMPVGEAAARIREDRVEILVDLMGYTGGARVGIVALRPAPVQVNFLGYPGTMGADFIDYLVADRFLVPPGAERHYSEQLVLMPASYQVNDRKRPVAQTPPRRDLDLPEDAFVFCCFSQAYKILPEVFDLWMRLLADMPGSVLWLLHTSPLAADNLRREASARGIAPGRLVFAPPQPLGRHLGRLKAADLFLDTYPYNAHTTASDALWVGVPLVTRAGETFASRVAGSLLSAVGLPELITHSAAGYHALALRLARHPAELDAVREKLQRTRGAAPLFDTPAFARNLETAYLQMRQSYRANSAPRPITL